MLYLNFRTEKWFIRRKLRCWVKLLDADQDGVISQDDMKKTNEKLEGLRKLFGARKTKQLYPIHNRRSGGVIMYLSVDPGKIYPSTS